MQRRTFLTAAMSLAATPLIGQFGFSPTQARAANNPLGLDVVSRSIEVKGKSANVFGLLQKDGTHGLRLNAGSDFDVQLSNKLTEPTLVHWHGLTPPNALDGVPENPAPLMQPGESRQYTFPVGAGGTHWMHAHTLQEQALLAAPLIVRTAEDVAADEQEVVVLLHDFSFISATELLAQLNKPKGMSMSGMTDANDINYDAYLANDRTLDDPEVFKVEKGGRVRLRIINGATATIFTIDTGSLKGELIAVDGQFIQPFTANTFPISMGQRLDIRINLPKEGGAFPILALRENSLERTGIILATTGVAISKLKTTGGANGPLMDLSMEQNLAPKTPLSTRKADRRFSVMLTGSMGGIGGMMSGMGKMMGMDAKDGYHWAMELDRPIVVKKGERIEIAMHNMSMMTHPMHLHGHHFQVVEINGQRVNGAVRDTVAIPHMNEVVFAFDANNPGSWAFHCHHLYHMATGMMTFVKYDENA